MGQGALDVGVPDLHVGQAIVGIDGEIIGDRTGRDRRKAVLQGQRGRRIVDIGCGDGERRLEGEILNDGGVLREIVIDAVARADHGLLQWTPGDADARSVIVAVWTNERRRKATVECAGRARENRGGGSESRGNVEIGDLVVGFGVRTVVFVAETEI